jgi:hypothetical protein
MPRKQTRGERAIRWIEAYCLVPGGLHKGQHVRLTLAQRDIVRQIYDGIETVPVTGPLAAYLALMHVCGPEALQKEFRPELSADIFTVWRQWALICAPCLSARAKRSFAANLARVGQRRREARPHGDYFREGSLAGQFQESDRAAYMQNSQYWCCVNSEYQRSDPRRTWSSPAPE